jgi:hypothetical protein
MINMITYPYEDECPLCGHFLIEDARGNSYCPVRHVIRCGLIPLERLEGEE